MTQQNQEAAEPPEVTLTTAEAEHICDTLIFMAVRLPIKHRDHARSLDLLGWFKRHPVGGTR